MKKLFSLAFFVVILSANFNHGVNAEGENLNSNQILGSITICKIIADNEGNISNGGDLAGMFTVPAWPLPSLTTSFTAPLNLNADILNNDGVDDAQCVRYGNLPIALYNYAPENIWGNGWNSPLYNDQFTVPADSLNDFFPFDQNNGNADGIIQLGPDRPDRTLVVLNTFNRTPQLPVCSDGVDNDHDGQIDFPADVGCENADDNNENAKPVVTLLGNNPEIVTLGTVFSDPGATANDSEDGNITSAIVKTGIVMTDAVGSYTVFYSVTDSGGLSDQKERTVLVKTQCTDGKDNDGDGFIDMNDNGCADINDNDETSPADENLPPYFTGPNYASTTVGHSFDFVVKANDPDNDVLIVTSTIPSGASYNSETGRFLWMPTQAGTSTASFSASDGAASTSFSVLLEVFNASTTENLPPYFVDFNPPQTATATLLYSYDVNGADPENNILTFSLANNPSGMVIDSHTGIISWVPTAEQATTTPYLVRVAVSDGLHEVFVSYSVIVLEIPTSSICSVNGLSGSYYNLPRNHPDAEGIITGVVPGANPFVYDWYNANYFAFNRIDPIETLRTPSDFFPVNQGLEGDPFYFAAHWSGSVHTNSVSTQTINIGSDDDSWVYINGIKVTDLGGVHPLAYTSSTITLPSGTSTIDIYFAERHTTQSGIDFSLTGDTLVRFSPCRNGAEINLPPYFTGPNYASTTVGHSFDFVVKANDPDNDVLIVTSTIPSGASYNSETGRFLWMPTQAGTSTASFSASDGAASTSFSVLLEVFNASTTENLPPYFVDFNPPQTATATLLYSYDVNGADPENDPLVFSLETAPQGMVIASSTGIIQWVPTQEQVTSTPYGVRIGLSDGEHSTSTSYAITVNPAPTSTTPTLTVIKHVINDGIGTKTASDFLLRVRNNNLEVASFYGSETGVTVPITVGSYSVLEDPVFFYFGTSSADCSGNIALNEHKICTVTNNDRLVPDLSKATLIVKKHVINDNGGTKTASDFTINVNGTNVSSSSFQGSETGTIIYLTPGVYSVNENTSDGYTKTIGENCSSTIVLGEVKTCVITNDDNAPSGGNNNPPPVIVVGGGGGGGGSGNYPPRFRNFNPPLFATATELYSYDVDSYDLENDPITHSFNLAPAGMVIASSTGFITWIPTLSQVSPTPYEVRIVLSDGKSSSPTIGSYFVTVVAPQGYIPPIASATSSNEEPEVNLSRPGGNKKIEATSTEATSTGEVLGETNGKKSLFAALIGALGNFFSSLNPFCVIVNLILLALVIYLLLRNRRLSKRIDELELSGVSANDKAEMKDIGEIARNNSSPMNLGSEGNGGILFMDSGSEENK